MSCMNAYVHDLHHCTKLQLCTRCSFGVMTLIIIFKKNLVQPENTCVFSLRKVCDTKIV